LSIDKASAAREREKDSRIKNQGKTNEAGRRHNISKEAYPEKLEQLLRI
jgi:hypothetical protein